MASQGSPVKMKELNLPMARVKTIMKSSPHVETVGLDGLFLVAKATEMFIQYLAEEAHTQSNKANQIDYKHLAEVVQTNETLEFLKEIMPRKITVRQFKELMAAKESNNSSSSETSSSDSDSDSESDSDSCSDSDESENKNNNSSGSESNSKPNGKSNSGKSDSSTKSDSDADNKS
ncbi:chromatin accessibility complex 16kD protein-like [Venturia canescens]|uniref:chromatin accessibility complex 16kD protein-like n=1 Tax=Venturia canescens TaxID=32260 RepID=UPI001C9BBF56|nr:chromatin accessibility complex 16kD protein-like [Venturia canescens]